MSILKKNTAKKSVVVELKKPKKVARATLTKLPSKIAPHTPIPEKRRKYQRQPTRKQVLMAENLAKGMNPTRAALSAGYSPHTAQAVMTDIMPAIELSFKDLIKKYAPAEKIVKVIAEGLHATSTKYAAYEGRLTDRHDSVNFAERRATGELLAKMGGLYNDKPKDEAGSRLDELIAAMKAGGVPAGQTNE